ncbi:MAG: hypothetical protein RIT04_245 [Candidatus Parcubacteria bacterium]|jgi:hypothetical protein
MFEEVIIYAPIWGSALIALVLAIIFLMPSLAAEYGAIFSQELAFFLITMPYWLPFFGVFVFWRTWVVYVRSRYLASLKWILLEIRLPQDVFKSPLAMETFLMALHQTGGETTFIDRWWKGQVRAHWSLEIISVEGQIKFIIYTQARYKTMVEAALYAQYPDIEIHEIPDYTKSFHYDPKENDLYVIDYKFKNPNPYPIKTYVDYGIDSEQVEEENKIDPINHMLEFMGSLGAHQQCWFQMIIRAHKKDQTKPGTLWQKTDLWKDEAKKEIEKIRASSVQKTDGTVAIKFPNPTKGEQERIAALERAVSKLSFDVGLRCIYMGKKEFFNGSNISAQRTILRAYSAPHLNELKPTDWLDGFDYPWQDFRDMRKKHKKRLGLEAYKRRSYFYAPIIGKERLVMSVEEIASIFHLPGQVTQTPNLTRIPSKKVKAPSNLPI